MSGDEMESRLESRGLGDRVRSQGWRARGYEIEWPMRFRVRVINVIYIFMITKFGFWIPEGLNLNLTRIRQELYILNPCPSRLGKRVGLG